VPAFAADDPYRPVRWLIGFAAGGHCGNAALPDRRPHCKGCRHRCRAALRGRLRRGL
jgi:hypothetical protein